MLLIYHYGGTIMQFRHVLLGMLAVMTAGLVHAQSFTYQGYLREGGLPANGTFAMTFRVLTTDGTVLGTVGPVSVSVSNGLFTQELNFGNIWTGADRYLEIEVGSTILSPRVKIGTAPYAHTASNSLRLQERSVSAAAPANGQVLKWNGTAWSPSDDLRDAFWQAYTNHIYFDAGKVAIGASIPLSPLYVITPDQGSVLWARNTHPNGIAYGVLGTSESTIGIGVFGVGDATSGINYGVQGRSESSSGTGVLGEARATTGGAWGVWGRTYSSSSAAHGLVGTEPGGSPGHAILAQGTLAASGTKSFQIDHPLRPDTHYLNHFCTEAPEPLNTYSGIVMTDNKGYATVRLPDYFESINRDFRYQLTVIDDSDDFILTKVTREIRDNRFVIRTDKPHVKVSWRVEAVRNDRWLQRHGFTTEQEKEDEVKGKYLHPELYGQLDDKGILHRPEPERPAEQEQPR